MILNIADIFRSIGRFGILVLGFTMVSIAIFSGALRSGITIANILSHLPDALPWLLLLFTLLLAWEYELVGGIIITILGLGGLYYFSAGNQTVVVNIFSEAMLMWAVIIFGISFILSWALRQIFEPAYS